MNKSSPQLLYISDVLFWAIFYCHLLALHFRIGDQTLHRDFAVDVITFYFIIFGNRAYFLEVCLCNLSVFVSQCKKHRLSVGHTNSYAKSVVNMADLVSITQLNVLLRVRWVTWFSYREMQLSVHGTPYNNISENHKFSARTTVSHLCLT